MTTQMVGKPIQRVEDKDLLTGKGNFTDDIKLPGTLHVAFIRAPFAHARITGIDLDAARDLAGVHLVMAAADLPAPAKGKRILLQVPNPAIADPITQEPLVSDRVAFAGVGLEGCEKPGAYAFLSEGERSALGLEPGG